MASAASISVSAKTSGHIVSVPDNELARLMYYLATVTNNLGIHILPDYMLDYEKYYLFLLSKERKRQIFNAALDLSPDELLGKTIFRDDERNICKWTRNEFVTFTTACSLVSVSRGAFIAGRMQEVTKVMFCTSGWLDDNYFVPLFKVAKSLGLVPPHLL